MAIVQQNQKFCVGATEMIGDSACAVADRWQWVVVSHPPASPPQLGNPQAEFTSFLAAVPGVYEVQRCCYFDGEGDQDVVPVAPAFNPVISCPLALIEGTTTYIPLNDAAGSVVTWGITGPATLTPNGNQGAAINVSAPGTITITISAIYTDPITGAEETKTDNCTFEVVPIDTQLLCRSSEPIEIEFSDECSDYCYCETATIIVEACDPAQQCVELELAFITLDCTPCEETPPLPLLTPRALVGSQRMWEPPADAETCILDCEGNPIYHKPHRPAIIFNEACTAGFEFQAIGAIEPGHDASDVCPCNPASRLCFRGNLILIGVGPLSLIDTIILKDHNIGDAEIILTPYTVFDGNPILVGSYQSGANVPATNEPLVFSINNPQPTTAFAIQIQPADPNKLICLGSVFAGQKMFLPEETIPAPWVNPHHGQKRRVNIKRNRCGVVSVTTSLAEKTITLPIRCITEQWAKTAWRDLMDYLDTGGPIALQWSIEQCPNDVFCGWVEDCVEGTEYGQGPWQTASLTITGSASQNQSVDFL